MVQCPSCNHGFEPSAGSDIPDRCPSCGALILARFCELQWVGGGGMGDVYRAREPEMGNRTVAIKVPRSQSNVAPMQERFEREIAASAQLQHENAVRVYGRGQERGRPYLVMEFVSGEKLSDVVRREHPLACRRVARIILGIARGLEHGGARGIVNRDIKPENIFLCPPDETPKILDYGLALVADMTEQVTRYGAILGTPSYLAPEQLLDPHAVTVAADVYSLGCTAYFCLTGKRPFEPRTADEIFRVHSEALRPHVIALRPDVPEAIDQIIQKMMASDEQARPTPHQVIAALQAMIPQLQEEAPSLPGAAQSESDNARQRWDEEAPPVSRRWEEAPPLPSAGQHEMDNIRQRSEEEAPSLPSAAYGARITASCPGCGEEFHLMASMAGKRIKCSNKLCNTIFEVPPAREPIEPVAKAPPAEPEGLSEILRDLEVPEQAPDRSEGAEASPGESAATPGPDDDPFADLPVVGEVVEGEIVPDPDADDVPGMAAETPASASATVSNEPSGGRSGVEIVRPSARRPSTPPDARESEIGSGFPAGPSSGHGPSPKQRSVPTSGGLDATLDFVGGVAAPETVVPGEPVVGEPVVGEPVMGEPVVGEPVVGEPVGGGAPPVEPVEVPGLRRRRTKPRKFSLAKTLVVGTAVLAGLLLLWRIRNPPPPPEPPWDEIVRLVREHKWDKAMTRLEKFEKDDPDDPHVPQVPFFRALCTAGDDIYSVTGDPSEALKTMQGIFHDHRDNPGYKEFCDELYKGLAKLMGRFLDVAERAADNRVLKEAKKALDVVKKARDAHELFATVGEAMNPEAMKKALTEEKTAEDEQIARMGHTPPEAADVITKTETSIRSKIAWLEMQILLANALDPRVDLDPLYRELRKLAAIWLQKPESELDRDEKFRKIFDDLRDKEYRRVGFEREALAEAAREAQGPGEDVGRQGNTLVVAWTRPDQPGRPSGADDDAVLALARGILYVFNPQGQLQWSRRLGLDSFRLPHLLQGAEWLTPALVAVSSEDQSLLALEVGGEPGRVRWRYRVGQDISAPLTVARLREDPNRPYRDFGFLPTAGGEVHVLELFRGRRIGRFAVGQPLTVGGVHWRPEQAGPDDPLRANGLVFFPADRERIFALNPSALFAGSEAGGKTAGGQTSSAQATPPGDRLPAACRYILFTKHSSGSLRGEPMVVGRYLVLSEAANLDQTSLRVLQVGEQDYRDLTPAGQHRPLLHGWAWFPPHRTPDRVTLVTDAGHLGVFGFNLDNPRENMYHVVQQDDMLPPQLSFRDTSRTLVVHAEEHLLWIMAGGRLQLFAVDVIHQKIHPVWKNRDTQAAVTGIPVHEAQLDRRAGTIYLTTMSPGGMSYRFSAVDAMKGALRWQCQLGMSIQGDPLLWKEWVVLLDRGGQKLSLRPSKTQVIQDRPRMVQRDAADPLPEGMDENHVLRLGEPPGPVYLLASDEQGSKLAARGIQPPNSETAEWPVQPWTVLPLPARETLYGRPCVLDGTLVVPCLYQAQGQVSLKMLPLGDGRARGDVREYTWTPNYPTAMGKIDLYPLGSDAILMVEGRRSLTRLELRTKDGVTQWDKGATERDPDGRVYHLREALVDRPLVCGRELLAFDVQGRCYRLDVNNPRRELAPPAATGLSLARAPVICGEYLLAIDRENRIVAFAPGRGSPPGGKPCWTSEDRQRRRILGEPVLSGDTLLVADNSRHVTGIGLADGRTRWQVPLKVHVGPAAAAVPYGPNHVLVPLADGTLMVLPIPEPQPQNAEKSQPQPAEKVQPKAAEKSQPQPAEKPQPKIADKPQPAGTEKSQPKTVEKGR